MSIRSFRLIFFLSLFMNLSPAQAEPYDSLVKIDVEGPITNINLPIHAHLSDALGHDYVLAIAGPDQLGASGQPYRIIDSVADGTTYVIGLERRKGAREEAARHFQWLLDDGLHILVRDQPGIRDKLSEMGFDLKVLPKLPIAVKSPATRSDYKAIYDPQLAQSSGIYDPRAAALINKITQAALYQEVGNLTGETPVTIDGAPYTITTRYTGSPGLEKATQYVYEQMDTMGLTVEYHEWSADGMSGRNVIGFQQGTVKPGEIILIIAHLDDLPATGLAPGADDNGSSASALLVAARIMSQMSFARTLRFVFLTGEEQGLLGSAAYATAVAAADENIVAVYNMDMIGWDSIGGPTLRLHTRLPNNPGYGADKAIAELFSQVVSSYGLSTALQPIIDADGESASDHSSFWDQGFPAILAIEDDKDDFNPHYHKLTDERQYFNMSYFTSFVRASAGTIAHLGFGIQYPDFLVTNVALAPGSPTANGTFSATVTVKNQGAVTGTPGTLQVWANQPTMQTCGAVGNKSVVLTSLAAGASRTVTVSGLPTGVVGVKTVRAFVNSACQTKESNDANNQYKKAYTVVAPAPDFVVTQIVLMPIGLKANGIFSAAITVKNQGAASGNGGYLDVWVNQPAAQTCPANGNAYASIGVLAAGASKTMLIYGLRSGAAGVKTFRAFADSYCQTRESNDSNNHAVKTYTVLP